MRTCPHFAAAVAVIFAAACSKESHEPTAADAGAPATVAHAVAQVEASTGGSSAQPSSQRSTWGGTYSSEVATIYIPPEWKNVHFTSADTTSGVGEGPISIEIEPGTGRVSGTVGGPLGPAVVEGRSADGRLTATIARKEAGDRGFSGTLLGEVGSDHISGTMNLALGEAAAVRKATFSLSRAR